MREPAEEEEEKHEFSHCKLSTCGFPIGGFSRAKLFSLVVAFKQLLVVLPLLLVACSIFFQHWWTLPLLLVACSIGYSNLVYSTLVYHTLLF
jgi:hypothetical protein